MCAANAHQTVKFFKIPPFQNPRLFWPYLASLAVQIPCGCGLACALLFSRSAMAADRGRAITLEQAYDRTLASDQSVRIAYLEIRKANLLPWSALTKFGPQINAGFSANHSETNIHAVNEVLTVNNADNTSLVLNQPLVDFTFFPAYRLGKLTVNSNRLQYQLTIRDVLFGVAKAYYDVLKQEKWISPRTSSRFRKTNTTPGRFRRWTCCAPSRPWRAPAKP